MKRHLIVMGAMFALLVSMASGALAQVPPEGCYLAPDGETFIDEVTGEVCVLPGEVDDDDDDDKQPPAARPTTELAATGATLDAGAVLALGLGMLVVGGGALGVSRRQRGQQG